MPTVKGHQLRIDRLLVSRGFGTRRDIQKWIRRGEVSYQGISITEPNVRVPIEAVLLVKGDLSSPLPKLLAYHKPLKQLSTLRDPWGRFGLDHVLPIEWRSNFHPVGRLDADTSGLLLFSSDGSLTQYLLHPKRLLLRRYRAVVSNLPENITQILQEGVSTALGCFSAVVEDMKQFDYDQHTDYLKQESGIDVARGVIWLSVTEGKHRMVRRMLHNAGASVLALHREQYGSVNLGHLDEEGFRIVNDVELTALHD